MNLVLCFFFFQAEDGIRYVAVTGVQTCALPILVARDVGSARDFEALPRRSEVLIGQPPLLARYREGEVELEVDLQTDHKTGGYLDQRAGGGRGGGEGRCRGGARHFKKKKKEE